MASGQPGMSDNRPGQAAFGPGPVSGSRTVDNGVAATMRAINKELFGLECFFTVVSIRILLYEPILIMSSFGGVFYKKLLTKLTTLNTYSYNINFGASVTYLGLPIKTY